MRGFFFLLVFFSFISLAFTIEIPRIGTKDFPSSAIGYFKMDHIFFGKITKVLYVDELKLRDHKIEVEVSGKIYKGSPPEMLEMTMNKSGCLGWNHKPPKVGQEYLFEVVHRKGKYMEFLCCLNEGENCEKSRRRYDYVTANGIASDEVLLDRFKEYQKMQAEEWRKDCMKKESSLARKGCLKTTDDILRM